jgi:hypothetical protein
MTPGVGQRARRISAFRPVLSGFHGICGLSVVLFPVAAVHRPWLQYGPCGRAPRVWHGDRPRLSVRSSRTCFASRVIRCGEPLPMRRLLWLCFSSGTASKLLNPEDASGPRTLAGDISHFCTYNHLLA